jgi:tRNA-dihydrouridine synthase
MTKINFWHKLNKPFFCVAPMYDVTDAPFRCMIAKYSKTKGKAVLFTEFVSADGLLSVGKKNLKRHLIFSEKERPIVVQLFGSNPETIEGACKMVSKMGFDGIDINMGCPDKQVLKQGAGSGLIKTPELAREIIRSAKKGAGKIPVSVKTRIGFNKNEIEKWLPELLAENPSAIIIHARTKKEMSKVPADWTAVARAVEIRDEMKSKTLIIGNGDVKSREEGIFGKPWLLNESLIQGKPLDAEVFPWISIPWISIEQKLKILLEHTKLFEKTFVKKFICHDEQVCHGGNFDVMKKHFKAYANGWSGAKELRIELMGAKNTKEVEEIIDKEIKKTRNQKS